ncbi:MAG: SDR family NAD(P)-dependent oxidoreductase [Acidimicrobiales bacterium]
MSLDSTVALVTGAQQGIGAATAEVLAERGATVVINYLDDKAAASALQARIEDRGGRAAIVPGDVANTADVANMVDIAESLGGINLLVNNAGIFPRVEFLEMTEDDWDSVFAVNLRGMFLCAQAAAKHMVRAGRGGSIINLASSAAHTGPPLGVHYGSTKAGVVGFTRSLASALSPHGIRANAVAPGLTDTAQPRYGLTEAEIEASATSLPLGRMASPNDIATTIAFLAGSDSRHITGQLLHVNGGQFFA